MIQSQYPAISSNPAAAAPREGAAGRVLSSAQLAAIHAVMHLFVDDDLAAGVSPHTRIHCDACVGPRPQPGAIRYERYLLCNGCATEYEVARIRGVVAAAGQYVRGKRFGEGDAFALPPWA
jgi:formate dehydrogenase maturation protein FdhE